MPQRQSPIAKWRAAIGHEWVLDAPGDIAPYALNLTGLSRQIDAIVKPGSVEDVQAVVRIANEYRTPLYPLSLGRNWGYGSRLPVRNGAVIVDLGRMNQIRNEGQLNVADHYALIEPGVTQRQLQTVLDQKGLPLLFNATAAGTNTSILGNSLERGFGYFGMRPEDISGLEVVLGNGEILRTGYGHYAEAKATYHYKYGIGPSLDGLFFQSNFGIVTCAAFNLLPRRECHIAVMAKLDHESLFAEFIDALGDLRRHAILESVVHIGNRNRMRITLGPLIYNYLHQAQASNATRKQCEEMVEAAGLAAWSAVGGLFGTRVQVDEALRQIKERLKGIASVNAIDSENDKPASETLDSEALRAATKPLAHFSLGRPADGAQLSPLWAIGQSPHGMVDDLDPTSAGLIFCPPALPLDGRTAMEMLKSIDAVFGRLGFLPYITLNMVNTKTLLCILNLVFERDNREQTEAAHKCVELMWDEFARAGFYPYRLDIESMAGFITNDDVFWQTAASLKQVFDPNHIIAPGRYNLI